MIDVNEWRSMGTLSLVNAAEQHAERLERSADFALIAWAPTVRQGAIEAKSAYAASRPLKAMAVSATAKKDRLDGELDGFVGGISYDLLGPSFLKGDRSSPAYRVLFPEGNIEFINGPDRVELARVQMMCEVLGADSSHPMAARRAGLVERAEALLAALDGMSTTVGAYEAARLLEKEKRDALERILRKSVHICEAELGTREKAAALFPTIRESRVAEDEPETAATAK